MNVIIIASEAVPFAKTGGLADVATGLARALVGLGHRVALVLPCYRRVWQLGQPLHATGATIRVKVGPAEVEGHVHRAELPGAGIPVYLIDQPRYFDRDGLYQQHGRDYHDNAERFIFFSRAALEAIRQLEPRPDLLHCHDWQTGLVPVYLREVYRGDPALGSAGSLLTIHNLSYQGIFRREAMALTGLDGRLFNWRQLEFHGHLNLLKAGLVFADRINTVSPTYAREIQTPTFGLGLDGVLHSRAADLRGIVNGIDATRWNPRGDPVLAARYDAEGVTAGKAACKAQLQRRLGLPIRAGVPLLAQIGRLVPQKGWDLIAEAADDLLRGDVQLVVLGTGLPQYHETLARLAVRYPGKVRVHLGFSDALAHQIEAGADLFLMPSQYEPCGLNQIYSLAYGTIPVVRATGGLADTVVDANAETLALGTANGFLFSEPSATALRHAIDRALAAWADCRVRDQLIQNGMRADWSWARGARAYLQLYDEIRRQRAVRAAAREPSAA